MTETIQTLTQRASCRKFKPEHISKEELAQVLAAGEAAPSGMNQQPQILVAVQSDALVKKLSAMNAAVMGKKDIDPFYGAPDVVIVLVRENHTCIEDGALALGNMLNAAYSLGLGSCWVHRAKEMFESAEGKALLKEWGLDENLIGVGCCILGYPDAELKAKERKPGRILYV